MARLEKLFNMSVDDAKRLLAFHRLDGDGPQDQIDELAAALGLQDAPAGYVQRLFSFFTPTAPATSRSPSSCRLAVLAVVLDGGEARLPHLRHGRQRRGEPQQPAGRHRVRCRARRLARRRRRRRRRARRPPPSRRCSCAAERPRRRAAAAFAKYDRDGNKVLDYDEWCAFVGEHADLLQLNLDVAADRMGALGDLALTVPTMKAERQASRQRRREVGTRVE